MSWLPVITNYFGINFFFIFVPQNSDFYWLLVWDAFIFEFWLLKFSFSMMISIIYKTSFWYKKSNSRQKRLFLIFIKQVKIWHCYKTGVYLARCVVCCFRLLLCKYIIKINRYICFYSFLSTVFLLYCFFYWFVSKVYQYHLIQQVVHQEIKQNNSVLDRFGLIINFTRY
jgi:hypothetical protein